MEKISLIKKVPPQGAGYGKRFARKPLVSIASLYFPPQGAGNYTQIIIKNIFKGKSFQDNADHVSWFDACTLCELGERHGLAIDSFKGIKHKEHNQKFLLLKRIFFGITALLIFLGLRSELFAKTMLYEFILEDNLN